MAQSEQFDVVIAGGGFVGLALAQALRLCSDEAMRIAVVDPGALTAPGGESDARASAISAGSRRLLETLGVWGEVAEHAQPMLEIEITDSALETPLRQVFLHYSNLLDDGEKGEPASHVVENWRLLAALQGAAENGGNITFFASSVVADYAADATAVAVTLADGRTLEAKLLVAADGRRSKLRRKAGIKTVGWSYDQVGIVTTVRHEFDHGGKAVQHFLPSGPFAMLPLKDRRMSLVWTERRPLGERLMGLGDDEFLAELSERFGGRLGEVALAGPRASWPLAMHLARAMIADRFVLVGDAAHGVHPIAGQGLNIALRDVAALVETIIEARRLGADIGVGQPLERYQRWRRFDSWLAAATMDGLNRLFSNDNALLRSFRDAGLGIVERSPRLKAFFVKEAAGLNGTVPRLLRGELI